MTAVVLMRLSLIACAVVGLFSAVWITFAVKERGPNNTIRSYLVYPAAAYDQGFPHIIALGNAPSATFTIDQQSVRQTLTGSSDTMALERCRVTDRQNWRCAHPDDATKVIGFQDGVFFQTHNPDLKGVSRWEFVLLVARWQLNSDSWRQKTMALVVPFRETI